MNNKDFKVLFNSLVEAERNLLETKGMEYSGTEDRFANFKRLSLILNLSPEKILWVYLTKHLDSISTYIDKGKSFSSESIHSRIHDARNYLALLSGIIKEREIDIKEYEEEKSLDDHLK